MGFTDRYLTLRIVAAEPERMLTQFLNDNVELLDITYVDSLTVDIKIKKQHEGAVRSVVEKNGGSCGVIGKDGLFWRIQKLWKRPILVAGIFLFTLASCVLNGRVLFVKVCGNEELSEKTILAEAENCGIEFGTKASKVRSEEVKNKLLKQLPQLQWVGINTSGTVATIQVKERSAQKEQELSQLAVSNIIASRDGVISEMTVYKGNPLFQVGQSVKEGDTLVSGYTDCGIVQMGERAEAEVFAHTFRAINVFALSPTGQRGKCTGVHTCNMIRIGKKVINFCNHSGISDASCVKMYEEDYWTLPGDFQLPVSVVKVKTYTYQQAEAGYDPEEFKTWLPQFTRSYTSNQMIAGSILSEEWLWTVDEKFCVLDGRFACHEMIGQEKYEEIIKQNAEDN